jgi:anti-sigma B factor antagonist
MIELNFMQMEAGVTELALQGDLNVTGADRLHKSVAELIAQGRCLLIVDCVGLKYVSSSGIGMLISLHRELREAGGQMLLAGATGPVFELLELMNLGSILELFADMDQARQAIATA